MPFLRKYTFLTVMLVFLMIPLFYSFLAFRYMGEEMKRDIQRDIMIVTEIVKKTLETMMLEGRGRDFHLKTLLTGDIHRIRLIRLDGTIIDSSDLTEAEKRLPPEELNTLLKSTQEALSHKKDGILFYSVISPIYNERPCRSCHIETERIKAILSVEMTGRYYSERLFNVKIYLTIILILSILLMYLIYTITVKRLINKPLKKISDNLREIASRIQGRRLEITVAPKFESIIENMNLIIKELDRKKNELKKKDLYELSITEDTTTLGELVSTIAHEIKNPLAGISGAIQVLMEEFDQNDPRREIIKEIVAEIERLDRSVKTLIQFARPEEPVMVRVKVASIIQRLLESIKDEAKKCGVRIITDFNPDMDVTLDFDQMNQVFINISVNALQSMSSGGELFITVKQEDNNTVFTFRDTGSGIPPEDLKRIFKPFFTTRYTGSGLGLAISKAIVEKHGGTIKVESIQGLGTTVSIIMPVREN